MNRAPRWILCAALQLAAAPALGQTSQPATAPSSAADPSLDPGIRLLSDVRDHVFSFDDPGFYWFCRYVREDANTAKYNADASNSDSVPWRFLLERPADYRGRLIRIEGRILRRSAYEVPNRAGVGRLIQCEIGERGTRAICTAVITDDPGDLPVGTPVAVRGFFIKIRSYETTRGEAGAGPLIVSKRISSLTTAAANDQHQPIERPGESRSTWLVAATAVLVIVWIAVRRMSQRTRDRMERRPFAGKAVTGSEKDFEWINTPNERAADSPPRDTNQNR